MTMDCPYCKHHVGVQIVQAPRDAIARILVLDCGAIMYAPVGEDIYWEACTKEA